MDGVEGEFMEPARQGHRVDTGGGQPTPPTAVEGTEWDAHQPFLEKVPEHRRPVVFRRRDHPCQVSEGVHHLQGETIGAEFLAVTSISSSAAIRQRLLPSLILYCDVC